MKENSGPINYQTSQAGNGLSIIEPISENDNFRIFKAKKGTKFVILKTPVSSDTLSVETLHREYELCRSLSHPCIVSTLGFEKSSPAGPAIVMEFIDGLPLDEFIAKGTTTAQRKSVLRDILDGVDYLHHRGILHNDLKPSNIIVNTNGAARIIDFGLSLSDDSVYNGFRGGTKGFSAPEILTGEGNRGAASDIYSIGVLIKLIFGGEKYNLISNKCMNPDYLKRYQSISELKKAISLRNMTIWGSTVAMLVLLPCALILINLSRQVEEVERIGQQEQTIQEEREDRILSLKDKYNRELAPAFNDMLTRMRKQKYQSDAIVVENEYFEFFLHRLDSLKKKYPISDTGENPPEIAVFCTIGQRQMEIADSIQRALPQKKATSR